LWRHTAPNRPALSGAGARVFGGRWNPADTVATIYLATTEACAREELNRLLRGQARGAVSFPRSLHLVQANGLVGVDLASPAALDAVGLTSEDLVDDDWTACQVVGNAVQYLGITALFAPSTTGAGNVVAVYEPHLRPGQLELIETRSLPDPRSR
jgi:RES domain-containing protein